MKAVLMSINPKWVEKIARGQKTIEVRKIMPKLETPFKCYIYETYDKKYANTAICWGHGNLYVHACKRVIGEFICDRIEKYKFNWAEFTAYGNKTYLITETQLKNTCLSKEEFNAYGCAANGHSEKLYGWHISDLVIYDWPKELSEFFAVKCTNKRAGCIDCKVKPNCIKTITRPPQSWCYCEEL